MPVRVGVDSYAYHRLLGDVRPGETPALDVFARGSFDVVAEARRLELDFALLQTSFLGDPAEFSPAAFLAEAGEVALGLSWGALAGFEFGQRRDALESLVAWLDPAAQLGLPLMRIVAGGPAHRGEPVGQVAGLLREACAAARDHGLRLALENHGDLTATQIERLLEQVGEDLRVCFDTANALRVGDDVAAAARRLAPAIEMLHLKDCLGSWEDPVAGPVSVPLGEGVIPDPRGARRLPRRPRLHRARTAAPRSRRTDARGDIRRVPALAMTAGPIFDLSGGLDILVTSHGTVRAGPALETSPEDWDATIEVNLTSVFELCRLAGTLMVQQGAGKIVTIASMLSFQGGFRAAAYSASKGGVAQLTKALANNGR